MLLCIRSSHRRSPIPLCFAVAVAPIITGREPRRRLGRRRIPRGTRRYVYGVLVARRLPSGQAAAVPVHRGHTAHLAIVARPSACHSARPAQGGARAEQSPAAASGPTSACGGRLSVAVAANNRVAVGAVVAVALESVCAGDADVDYVRRQRSQQSCGGCDDGGIASAGRHWCCWRNCGNCACGSGGITSQAQATAGPTTGPVVRDAVEHSITYCFSLFHYVFLELFIKYFHTNALVFDFCFHLFLSLCAEN